jgi:hypothetical protein
VPSRVQSALDGLPSDDSHECLLSDTCLERVQDDSGDNLSTSARETREQGPVGLMTQWGAAALDGHGGVNEVQIGLIGAMSAITQGRRVRNRKDI